MTYKLTRKKDDTSTIRKVWTEDKTRLLGVVGQFKDFEALGIIEQREGGSPELWVCLPHPERIGTKDGIGETREEAIHAAHFGRIQA